MFNRFVMIVGVFLLCSSPVIAQHKIWVEADGSIYIQRGDNGIFGASILGKKEIKKKLFIGVGVTWLMSRLDASGTKVEDGVRYSMDASTVYRFAGKLTATWNIPVAFQSGFYVDGTLMADILPFDYAKLHRDVGDSKNHNRGKLLFTGFSPGAFIGGGIYHERNIRCVSLWDWNTVTLISFMPIDTAEFMVRGFHLLSIQAGRGMGLRFDSVAFENSRLSV